jgi:hypothetical protein
LCEGKGITIEEEIGKTAGAIWDALNTRSEQSLSELKIAAKGKEPTFDWAIEWLARENQIAITPEKRPFRMSVRIAEVCLAEPAITPFAILGGDNHARLVPGRSLGIRIDLQWICSRHTRSACPQADWHP